MKEFVRGCLAVSSIALGAATLSCAPSRALNCPGEFAGSWKQLESPHFQLVTNRPLDQARIALADFEEAYDVFTGVVLSGEMIDPVPIRVVLFERESEYKAFAPRGAGAFFNPGFALDPEPIPTLVMWGDLVAEARLTFQHELTHHIFRNALGPVPTWLTEGLADYYATVRIENDEVYIGESNPTYEFYLNPNWAYVDTGPYLRYRIPVGDIPKANELMALDREGFYERGNKELDGHGDVPIEESKRRTARYAGSWALVHMLTHHPNYGERWAELLAGLAAGKGYPTAMDEAFGPVMDSIPAAFHEYLITHHRTAVKTKYVSKARVCPKAEQELSESRVKIMFAQLRPFRGRISAEDVAPEKAMEADLDSAVQLDSQSASARLHRGLFHLLTQNQEAALTDIEAAYQKAPQNRDVALGVARLCLQNAEQSSAVQTFCTTNVPSVRDTLVKTANTPHSHLAVAMLLEQAKQSDAALDHAKRAVKQNPGCAPCLEVLGELLHTRGMIREAIVFEERALAALPETAKGDKLAERIRQYRKELIEAAKARKSTTP